MSEVVCETPSSSWASAPSARSLQCPRQAVAHPRFLSSDNEDRQKSPAIDLPNLPAIPFSDTRHPNEAACLCLSASVPQCTEVPFTPISRPCQEVLLVISFEENVRHSILPSVRTLPCDSTDLRNPPFGIPKQWPVHSCLLGVSICMLANEPCSTTSTYDKNRILCIYEGAHSHSLALVGKLMIHELTLFPTVLSIL